MFGTPEQQERWLRAAARGRDPLGVRHDRAGGGLLRRHQHRVPHRARRRRLRHQRAQVVDLRARCAPAARSSSSWARPTPTPRRTSSSRWCWCPMDTPGITVVRNLNVFGYTDREGHAEVIFDDVRVPVDQPARRGGRRVRHRPGPPRPRPHPPLHAHHRRGRAGAGADVRAGARTGWRSASRLAEQGVIQRVDRRRPHRDRPGPALHAVHGLADGHPGNKAARTEISGIKVAVPNMALRVIDHAIQAHGAGGRQPGHAAGRDVRAASARLRLADGPDEVHRRTIARRELGKSGEEAAETGGPR